MAKNWIEVITGSLELKKRYREHMARVKQLPANYQVAIDGVLHYIMYVGGSDDGEGSVSMIGALVDMFEESAANNTPIRSLVGEDPVEFVEEFLRNYPSGSWIIRERERLADAIKRAAGEVK